MDGVTTVFIYSFAFSHDLKLFHAGNLSPCFSEKGLSMTSGKTEDGGAGWALSTVLGLRELCDGVRVTSYKQMTRGT